MFSWLKSASFLICLIPFGQLLYRAYSDDLGANPIETSPASPAPGPCSFCWQALAVTPLRRITGWNDLIKFRRMLGLFAFFYAALHFSTYMVLDLFFDFAAIAQGYS